MIRFLVAGALLLASVSPAWAIPACWSMTPRPGEHPFDGPTATPTDCGAHQGFLMVGTGGLEGLHIEFSPAVLAFQWTAPEDVSPQTVFFYGPGFGYSHVVDPDPYVTQWLLGSDWWPASAEWAHANGFMPHWGPYPFPTPLEHSPEPATVALVLTTAGLIGWRKWRAR